MAEVNIAFHVRFLARLRDNQRLGCGLWQPSRMAITNDLPSVFCCVSQMASSHISCFTQRIEVRETSMAAIVIKEFSCSFG